MATPVPSVCEKCEMQDCENCKIKPKNKCGAACEIWSRPCGYNRPFVRGKDKAGNPIPGYNPGKMEEMNDRKVFKVS